MIAPLLVALFAATVPGMIGRTRAQDGGEGEPPANGPKPEGKPEEPRGGLRELAPSWRPGLSWDVFTNPLVFSMPKDPRGATGLKPDKTRRVTIHFEVRATRNVDGNACHELVLTSDHAPDDEITLDVRAQDLSVKELRHKKKSSGAETVVKNGRTPFFSYETAPLCPYDFPLFPRETKDEERTFDLGEGREVKQSIKLDAERNCTVVLSATVGGVEIVTTQQWKRGAPFWSKATRTRGGAIEATGELDESSIRRPAGDVKPSDGREGPGGH